MEIFVGNSRKGELQARNSSEFRYYSRGSKATEIVISEWGRISAVNLLWRIPVLKIFTLSLYGTLWHCICYILSIYSEMFYIYYYNMFRIVYIFIYYCFIVLKWNTVTEVWRRKLLDCKCRSIAQRFNVFILKCLSDVIIFFCHYFIAGVLYYLSEFVFHCGSLL